MHCYFCFINCKWIYNCTEHTNGKHISGNHNNIGQHPGVMVCRHVLRAQYARVCASSSRKLALAMAMLARSSRSCFQRMVSQPLPPAFFSAFFFSA